ncbi:hypothetical protein Tco_1194005 [Tanacetum coccineum]
MFIGLSTGLIPPKIGRGKGAQGSKATVTPKKETAASKKKKAKKIESSDEESKEQEERLIRRKPRGVVIQDTPQVLKKTSTDPSQKLKLKCIDLLSDAAQLEIDTQRAIKANKYELTGKSAVSDERVGTSPEVLDETKDKKDIPWVLTDEDDSDDDDESDDEDESDDKEKEDDESIDIEKTDNERTELDNDDHEMLDAVKTDVAKEHEENAKKVEEQKAKRNKEMNKPWMNK